MTFCHACTSSHTSFIRWLLVNLAVLMTIGFTTKIFEKTLRCPIWNFGHLEFNTLGPLKLYLLSFFGGTNKRSELGLINLSPKQFQDTSRCIPLRIYGDGADAQQHFEIFTMLPILGCSSSTLDSRILLNVRNTEKTTPEARRKILEIIAWSFESLRTLMEVVLYLFSFKKGRSSP